MSDREKVLSIVKLLRQGLKSAVIAKQLAVSPQTVWGVKANFTQGKYDPIPIENSNSKLDHKQYDYVKKSKAILDGYINKMQSNKSEDQASEEFARLLALITSPKQADRNSAKNEIRDLAKRGGWMYHDIDSNLNLQGLTSDQVVNSEQHDCSFYEKLIERREEILSFTIQLSPIPKPNELWIFGDHESYGKMIEHYDAIKARQDVIQRLAKIFIEWMYVCAKINNAPELINFARLFERHLNGFPKTILRLIHLEKMNNTELIDFLKLLCTDVEELI